MNIAIDCRYIGMSGIGRVCEGILDNLDYTKNKYFLIGKREKLAPYSMAEIVEDDTAPYSIKGLFSFDKKLNKTCDAMIIPNFLVPMGVKIPVYTVMHDLAFLDVKSTTNGLKDRLIKKYLLKRGMKKSKAISCVSRFTLGRCKFFYKGLADKCYVNYFGLSKQILEYGRRQTQKEEKIVFVGNVKPHKGLKTLIAAYKKLQNSSYKLKIIGQKDNFAVGLDTEDLNFPGVEFTGKISDDELFREISSAKMLILPSEYEGFGVPPLEALYLGTKPIISDIEVFKEVYSDFDVEFFRLKDADDLCEKIQNLNCNVNCSTEEITDKFSYKNFVGKILEKIEEQNN